VDHSRTRQGRPCGVPLADQEIRRQGCLFIFAPADKVMAEAKRLDATPYDVKDVELGHHGKECSLEAILKKCQLTGDPALVLLGRIVNGADTDNTLYALGAGTPAGGSERRCYDHRCAK